jgi:FkbM family methyltransferase
MSRAIRAVSQLARAALRSQVLRNVIAKDVKLRRAILRSGLEALGYGNYESLERSGEAEFIRRIARTCSSGTAIDIGANVGAYSQLLLEAGFRSVIAVEPHPDHAVGLQALVAEHSPHLTVIQSAVGRMAGSADLHFSQSATSHASLAPHMQRIPYVHDEEHVAIEVMTLDELVESHNIRDIDLLKIDVEGEEMSVLEGARRTLKESPPRFIQIEYNQHQLISGHSMHDFAEVLDGFRCVQLLPDLLGAREVDPIDPLSNIYAYSNFVFVRDDRDLFLLRN